MKVYRDYNQYDEELRSYIDYDSSVDGTLLAVNVPFKVIPIQPYWNYNSDTTGPEVFFSGRA